jgi:cytoskeletal protein CcmA (bactofilin family)
MSFPSSPTNGQQATLNNVVYIYDSVKNAWARSGTISSTVIANALIINGTVNSTSTSTGSAQIVGGLGVQGNVTASNISVIDDLNVAGDITASNISIIDDLNVAGDITASNISIIDDLNVAGDITIATNLTVTGNAVIGSFYSNVQRVAIDFGNTAAYNTVAYVSDSRAQIGAKVFVTPSAYTANSSAQLGGDELEFDNFFCAANVVATGNIAVYITAFPGPVKGERNFDYILG